MARRASVVLPLLLVLNSCAYHRLVVRNPDPADQYYHSEKSTAVGWGAIEQQRVATKCETSLLSEVRVRTSLGSALITVLTLGLVQPSEVQYRCAKRPAEEGEIKP